MRRYVGLDGLSPEAFRRPVVTIGVFDGMHRGHRHLIEGLRAMADRLDGEAVVLTFDTHPLAVIRGEAPRRILSVEHRLLLLERNEVDATVLLPFDETIRRMTHERFVEDLLVRRMGIRGLLFGYNSNFGYEGRGTPASVAPLGERFGFEVAEAPPITLQGHPISSSRIRDAIQSGDLEVAAEMLGRPVALYGIVVRGDGRGRTIGFPTANVSVPLPKLLPAEGVYAGWARLERHPAVAWPAAIALGSSPTFLPRADGRRLEVHLIGFAGDLLGQELVVGFSRRLRGQRPFGSREELIEQIHADIAEVGG